MVSDPPSGRGSGPSHRRRRRSIPNEDALRALAAPDGPANAVANEHGLRALGAQIARSKGGRTKRPRRYRKLKWTLGILGLVIVLLVGAGAGYGWYLNHEVHRITVKDLSKAPTTGADATTQNILMVGSTSRCALKVQNPIYGLCSQGVTGVNGDVIMVLHLDPRTKTVSIISIPRDLFVPQARTTGANKIDAALYQGANQLVNVIQQDFGIPIQHFVELNFDTFAGVVNALGGVKMYFPMPVYDAYSQLNITTPGCHFLGGFQALALVRARHLQYKPPTVTTNNTKYWPHEAQSDLARIRRDHEFLRVLASKVAKQGISNPITDARIVSAVAPQLTTDMSASDMIHIALAFHAVNFGKAPEVTLPVLVGNFGSYTYKGVPGYGDIEFPDRPVDQQVIDSVLGVSASTNTMTGEPLPPASSVSLTVEDGSGVYNQAATTASALSAWGFHVTGTGVRTPVGAEAETVVYYNSMSPAVEAQAQVVADALSGSVIMSYDPTQVAPGSSVTLVTGTGFSVNTPSLATTPATSVTGSSGTSATPATSAVSAPGATSASSAAAHAINAATPQATLPSNSSVPLEGGKFSPPTNPNQALQPWDPRACTPSGGEGP